nr:isochorismatase family protein [Pantoea agglomerans]
MPQAGDIVLPNRVTAASLTPARQHAAQSRDPSSDFTGIATNVCVESTLRDGFFLEYFGVVLEDATYQAGPPLLSRRRVQYRNLFGWVSDVDTFCEA